MKKYILLLMALLISMISFCQDFSNKGKDFWVGYGYHQIMTGGGNVQDMVLYFATDQVTHITITIPGNGYTQTIVTPSGNNVTTSVAIPKTGAQDARLTVEGISDKGIHITSDKPMVAYAHIYNASVSGATILYPTNTLGKDYYSVNYKNWSNSPNANCWFYVVATEPGVTTINITPTGNTTGGWTAGNTYSVNLNQGQIYNIMGALISSPIGCSPVCTGYDLTGSVIQSVASGSGGCKKIAVFSGSGRISITCNNNNSSSDNYMVQAMPKTAWGKTYLTVPASGNQSYNFYRICVTDPATVVKIDGTVTALPLQGNFYYEISATNQPHLIEGDKPIMVAQYFTSQTECGNGSPGDPEVIYLSSVEQNISTVQWNATPNYAITDNYFNVVIPNTGTALSSFTLDGAVIPPASFITHPQNSGFSYLQKSVSVGQHIIQSDSGFNAIAYGFGNHESYGYNAGTNIKDLYTTFGTSTQFGIDNGAVCTGTPFRFKISLPYKPDSIHWDLSGILNIPQYGIEKLLPIFPADTLAIDSITYVNNRSVYWYSLPGIYNLNNAGSYNVPITLFSANADGCGNEQDKEMTLDVTVPPSADFTWIAPGCAAEPVSFIDLTSSVKPTYKWWWDLGDGNFSTAKTPVHTYATPGTYTVRYANITTSGCLSDTIAHQVNIPVLPTATISGNTSACINANSPTITFTGTGGLAPYIFTFTINGVAQPPVTSDAAGIYVLSVPTNLVTTFTYNLIGIQNASPTNSVCSNIVAGQSATVTIIPDATLTLSSAIGTDNQTTCINTAITNISYTIGGSGTGVTVSGLSPGVVGNFSAGVLTISGTPTSAASSPYIYTVSSTGPCGGMTVTGTITVNLDHTLALTSAIATTNQSLCLSGNIVPIVYTFGGGATSVTVSGLPSGVVSNITGTTVTISGAPTTFGTFTYTIQTIGNTCATAQLGGTITVYPPPSVGFTNTTPACDTRLISFVDNTLPNVGTVTNWAWTFGDLASGANNTSTLQNPTHTFTATGNYTVSLTATTSNGCTITVPFTKMIVINDKPTAGFVVPKVCINDAAAVFTDTSKIANGTISPAGYVWDFGDASPKTFTQDGIHLYLSTGIFQVTHVVTSLLGCADTIVQPITISDANPMANFLVNNASSLCANDSVAVVDLSTINFGNITKVQIYWDAIGAPAVFDVDNFPGINKVYKHKYPNFQAPLTKPYTIKYVAYSGTLCFNTKNTIVTINAAPKVQFNNMPDICYNAAPYQITQASEVGGVPGTFVYSGPGVSATGLFNPAVAGIGTHTIKYTFTATAAGCVDTISNTIKVLDTAMAKFSFTQPTCAGSAVNFSETSSAPNGVTLTNTIWNFGDGSPLQNHLPGSSFTHLFPSANNYTVSMYNTSAYGCNSTSNVQQVLVSPNPQTVFSFVQSSVCLPNAAVSFINNSTIADGSAITYKWYFGDPASGKLDTSFAITPPPHIYSGTGPYTVTLTAGSGMGCTTTLAQLINFIHPQPKANFTFNKPSVCLGDIVTFTDLSDGVDGSVVQWNWNFGDGLAGTNMQEQHKYALAKTYNVSLYIINSNGCNSDTVTQQYTIYPYPVVNAGADDVVLQGGSIALHPTVTGNNLQYLWSPATYLNSTTILAPTAINVQDDITYKLVVTGQGGCTALPDYVFIKVLKAPKIPNTFTPNGDGYHDRWVIEYLDTYPNCKVQVFTRTGQLVFLSKGYKTPWDGTINGKSLPLDTYYYIIEPGSGRAPITGYVTLLK